MKAMSEELVQTFFCHFLLYDICFLQIALIFSMYNSYLMARRHDYDRKDGIKTCQSNGDGKDNK